MADSISVLSSTGQVHSGKCQLVGMIITYTGASGGKATFDDSVGGSGTKLVEVVAGPSSPVIVFFGERFYPLFSTGMYLTLGSPGMSATLWVRQL